MAQTWVHDLEQAIGHRFNEPALAARALTHRSAIADRGIIGSRDAPAHNEQLEYLGDAVLEMIVSEHLVQAFPHWTEGQLSKSRARLVNASSLSSAARRLDLGRYLQLGRGEEKTGGREKPALLGDALEALVAAVYLDAGLEAARSFVKRALIDTAIEAHGDDLERSDHKSALQELLQKRGLPRAIYEVVLETGPDHRKMFS